MKRHCSLLLCVGVISAFLCAELVARGPGGGGRGGGGASRGGGGASRGGGGPSRGGGGMSRPSGSSSRSPSMSRPSSGMSRPSGGGSSRPSTGGSRPSSGSFNRPSTGSRPSAGNRPSGGTTPGAGNRPDTGSRPSGGSTGPGNSGRPSQGQLNDFLELPKAGGGSPSSGTRPSNGGSDFLQNRSPDTSQRPNQRPTERPSERPAERPIAGEGPAADSRPDRVDDRQGNRQDSVSDQRDNRQDSASNARENTIDNRYDLADNRVGRVENAGQRQTNRVDRRVEVRGQVAQNPPRKNFWTANRYAQRWPHPYRAASWGAVAAWFPWGWSQPVGYNYGDNVYVQGDSVYYGEKAVGTQEEYGEQAYAIASGADDVAPDESADDSEWMSLGVFALTQDGQASGPEPNLFVQLAVSKEGMIAGTYFNSKSDKSQDVAGVVDKKTQRTAWTVGAKDWPVTETGISNLTKDEAPALIHFADGQTQKWLMVRLEDSDSEASQ